MPVHLQKIVTIQLSITTHRWQNAFYSINHGLMNYIFRNKLEMMIYTR